MAQPSDDCGECVCRSCAAFLFWCGFIGLICYAIDEVASVWRGSKPTFELLDVTVYEFSPTPLPSAGAAEPRLLFLNTTMRVTLSSRNPNARVGIYYFDSAAYASYRGENITLPKTLPEFNQGHKAVTEWSPLLEGRMAPLSSGDLARDLITGGTVPVDVKVDGWLKFDHESAKHRLLVNCPVLLMADALAPTGSVLSMKFQPAQRCTVDVIKIE